MGLDRDFGAPLSQSWLLRRFPLRTEQLYTDQTLLKCQIWAGLLRVGSRKRYLTSLNDFKQTNKQTKISLIDYKFLLKSYQF